MENKEIEKDLKIVESVDQPAIIGTFEGKCGDGAVTNENGLNISKDVWQTVFDSDEFKSHLKNGFYIGFLGHPEDPGCQDFEHACIILRECHLEEDGSVIGKCDLINTPVGRIVKTFIDAGVKFGLSVRGAGDIIGDDVDPETFVFRGFDVVAFPAYTDAIPEFKAIAASSDPVKAKKYKKICASIADELPQIDDIECLTELQSQFDEGTEMYDKIQDKIDNCCPEDACCNQVECPPAECLDDKFEGLMVLYLKSLETIKELKDEICELKCNRDQCERELFSSKRIYTSQINTAKDNYNKLLHSHNVVIDKHKKMVSASKKLKAKNTSLQRELNEVKASASKDKKQLKAVKASSIAYQNDYKKIQLENEKLHRTNSKLKDEVETLKTSNLNYKKTITSSEDAIAQKDSEIKSLNKKLSETVTATKKVQKTVSNRDAKVTELNSDVKAALNLVEDYQNAYAELYSGMLGVSVDDIVISNTTTVDELKELVSGATNTSAIGINPDFGEVDESDNPYYDEHSDDIDII